MLASVDARDGNCPSRSFDSWGGNSDGQNSGFLNRKSWVRVPPAPQI